MITWVLYDIKKDKARNRAAKYCKQAGLYRVQYSTFIGNLGVQQRDALSIQLENEIDSDEDKVYILPMSKDDLKQTVLLGKAFDKAYVSDEVKALFL
ncbi:MAG: CRISPR-associated endonuclease Cas2 [Cyclobacteriaceae bacterium]